MASSILRRASASVSPAEAHPGSSGQTADQLSAMGSCSSTTRNFRFSVSARARFGLGWQFGRAFIVTNLVGGRELRQRSRIHDSIRCLPSYLQDLLAHWLCTLKVVLHARLHGLAIFTINCRPCAPSTPCDSIHRSNFI